MRYGEEIRRLGLKVEILSREIMVELIEKVMCEQRHSERDEGVRWISRGRAFQGLGLDLGFAAVHISDLGQVT